MATMAGASVCLEVASSLRDVRQVERAVAEAGQRATRRPFGWAPHAVARGSAGLAILCGQLDRCLPGAGWDRAAHDHLEAAVASAMEERWLPDGLFTGVAGLGFAT